MKKREMISVGVAMAMAAYAVPSAGQAIDSTGAAPAPTAVVPRDGAKAEGPRLTAALTAGTLGIGPDIGLRLSDHLGIRRSATFFGSSHGYESDDIRYTGNLKLQSFGAMADLYPFGGSFRISAGARINANRVAIAATPSDQSATVEVGNAVYSAADVGTLTGRGEPKRFSPALTLGWAGRNRKGFFLGAEAGILFQGAFKLKGFRASGRINDDAEFREALERERVNLQDDVDTIKIWPIGQIILGWRF